MDKALYIYHYIYLFSPVLVAFFLGVLLGVPTLYNQTGIRTRFLIFNTVIFTTFTVLFYDLLTQFETAIGFYLGITSLVLSAFMMASLAYFNARNWNQSFMAAFVMLFSALLGVCLGLGSYYTVLFLYIIYVCIVVGIDKFIPTETRIQRYIIDVECFKESAISSIEKIFETFPVKALDKEYSRKKAIRLVIRYEASPLIQHLLLKKLYQCPGLGKIITL